MKRRSLLGRIFSNMLYKFLAVAIACVVWYVVQGEEILEINRRLDVTIEVPPGIALREEKTFSRDVTLRGPRVALSDFSSRPIQAVIRIPPGKKGNLRYRIDKEYIPQWDNRIKITVHDPIVNIFADERASRSIPVKVSLQGVPKSGATIHEVKAEPPEITITGLKSEVQKQVDISTEVVDINGLSEGKSFPVPLAKSNLLNFDYSAQQVVVHVTLGQGKINKTFDVVPIEVTGSERLSNARPNNVSVTIQGSADVMGRLVTKDVQAIIDARDLGPGRYEKEITIKLPPGAVAVGITPKSAVVEIYNQSKLR